jgi:hypothetical protein
MKIIDVPIVKFVRHLDGLVEFPSVPLFIAPYFNHDFLESQRIMEQLTYGFACWLTAMDADASARMAEKG